VDISISSFGRVLFYYACGSGIDSHGDIAFIRGGGCNGLGSSTKVIGAVVGS